MNYNQFPEYEAWNNAAVYLLRGAVYYTNESLWNAILSNTTRLNAYFAHLGLVLVIDEADGLAYLRPMQEDEQLQGYDTMPKIFHRTRLNYSQTLLCVLLRELLHDFETNEVHDEYCAVVEGALFEQWQAFGFSEKDEVALHKVFLRDLRKLDKIGFVDTIEGDSQLWRVNSIIKARIPADKLEEFHQNLQQEVIKIKKTQGDLSNE